MAAPQDEHGGTKVTVESQLEMLHDLMGRQEELDPELAAYIDPDGPLGPALRHPLVYNICQHPQMNAMVNMQLQEKKRFLAEALRKRQWQAAVFIHERPWRIDAFANYAWRMGDKAYWRVLGNVYTDTENLWQNYDMWIDCLQAHRPHRVHLMNPEERHALKGPNRTFKVYRGWHEAGTGEHGLSWTSDSNIAMFFAGRFAPDDAKRFVSVGTVEKRDVLAFFNCRNEQEFLVLPGNVHGIESMEVTGEFARKKSS